MSRELNECVWLERVAEILCVLWKLRSVVGRKCIVLSTSILNSVEVYSVECRSVVCTVRIYCGELSVEVMFYPVVN